MKDLRQAILGILAAVISAGLLFGSLSLALVEGDMRRAMAPSPTLDASPTMSPPGFTPSLTPSPEAGVQLTGTPFLIGTPTPIFTSSPTIPVSSICSYPSGWSQVTVFPGDTLESLAATYNISPDVLMNGNCLQTSQLIPGTILYVPGIQPTVQSTQCGPPSGWVYYTVRYGDTLFGLALYFNVTVEQLQFANCMSGTLIRVGQNLYVPNLPTPTYPVPPTNPPSQTPGIEPTSTQQPTSTLPPAPTNTPTITITPPPPPTEIPTSTVTLTHTPEPTVSSTPTATFTVTPFPTNGLFNAANDSTKHADRVNRPSGHFYRHFSGNPAACSSVYIL